ncbi:MAG TPA: hypothetical protein VIV12_01090 [Streptosporangiaceae bacterium]
MFAGKTYKDQAEAEQAHKSLQGMFKPMQDKITATEVARDQGYQVAHQWKQYAEQLAERVAALQSGQPGGQGSQGSQPAGSQPAGQATLEDVLSDVDFDAFEAIAVEGGLPLAGKYLATELLKVVNERILPTYQERVASTVGPVQEYLAGQAALAQKDQELESLRAYTTMDNQPAFPELMDASGAAMRRVGETWANLGLPPEMVLSSKEGLIRAIYLDRLIHQGVPPAQAVAAAVPQIPVPAAAPAAGVAASVPGEPGQRPAADGRSNIPIDTQRFIARLKSAGNFDSDLGFERAPRRAAAR